MLCSPYTHCDMQCYAALTHTVICSAMQSYPHCDMQCHAVFTHTVICSAMQSLHTLWYAVPCRLYTHCGMQCIAVLTHTVVCSAMQSLHTLWYAVPCSLTHSTHWDTAMKSLYKPQTVTLCTLHTLSPEGRPGDFPDVSPLSGISGLPV